MNINNTIIKNELGKYSFGGSKGFPNTRRGKLKLKFTYALTGKLIQSNVKSTLEVNSIIKDLAKKHKIYFPFFTRLYVSKSILNKSKRNLNKKVA